MRLAWLGMTVEVGVRSDGRAGHGSTALATGAPPLQNRRERGRREVGPSMAGGRERKRDLWRGSGHDSRRGREPRTNVTGAQHPDKVGTGAAPLQRVEDGELTGQSRDARGAKLAPLGGTIPTRSGQVVSCPYGGF